MLSTRSRKILRAAVAAFGAAVTLSGCASVYDEFAVNSTTAKHYYFIRRDIWDAKGFDNPAKRDAPGAIASYGPMDVGFQISLDVGAQYVIIPVCDGRPAWDKAVRPVISKGVIITISCHSKQ